MPNPGIYRDIVTSTRSVQIDKEVTGMQRSINAVSHLSGEDLRFNLLLGVTYPFFVAVEALGACVKALLPSGEASKPKNSIFAAAKDNAAIAISYAFMARSTLQIFARRTRPERLS